MKMKRLSVVLSILIALSMLLAACAPAATEAPAPQPAAPEPTKAPAPEPTAVPAEPVAEEPADPNALPRDETLYFNGLQWNPIKGWNPYSSDMNNAMGIGDGGNNYSAQIPVFETLYINNIWMAISSAGDGLYLACHDRTVKIRRHKVMITPVTAEDVILTPLSMPQRRNQPFIDTIEEWIRM
jgi:peptide/nickel transport system substrate-binding protein